MKKYVIYIVLAISLIANIGMIAKFLILGDVIDIKDERVAVMMTEENRKIVLTEMREFLSNVQKINEGILENDPQKIMNAASNAGSCVKDKVPKGLIKSLPIAFKEMGFGTHDAFDDLTLSVGKNFNPRETQEKLNSILKRCVACHNTYQIKTYK